MSICCVDNDQATPLVMQLAVFTVCQAARCLALMQHPSPMRVCILTWDALGTEHQLSGCRACTHITCGLSDWALT